MHKNFDDKLFISEIFYSFQGESTYMGRKTLFIRLSGCNLNCKMCDTKYAFKKNKTINIDDILKTTKKTNIKNICITGGEPLIQIKPLIQLVKGLMKNKKIVSIETNGSIPIKTIPLGVKRVIDVKTPTSGHQKSFNKENLKYLNLDDEIKFVISNKEDFLFAENFVKKNKLDTKVKNILLSPNLSKKGLPERLIKWILMSTHDYIFQPQLHKLIKEKPIYLIKSL